MKLNFTTLDVFTTTPYHGNPLAVIPVPSNLKSALTQTKKLAIAKEFNLSEIVFIHLPDPSSSSSTSREINIFTIHDEMPFAGHPTIGASHYILNILGQKDVKRVLTPAGRIPIELDPSTGNVRCVVPQDFRTHSGTFHSDLNGLKNPVTSIVKGVSFIFAPLRDLPTLAKATKNLNIDSFNTTSLDEGWQEGVLATMYYVPQGTDEFGRKIYRTRMLAWMEDPGTGSASSALACHLALMEKEERKGPFRYAFVQGVEMGRRNEIGVEVVRTGNGKGIERVLLSGTAVKVMEGSLIV